ncbi:MAG: DUF3139 domain-containing protein [Anaerotignum sp.]|nr:DUF3139 domain-containing protein [Anaerotignum sp.]
MRKKYKIMIALVVIMGIVFVYQYPVQKYFALKEFGNYINTQGIKENNIYEKKAYKDWKNGGYLIAISLKDDPNNKYYYHYKVWTHKKGEDFKLNRMVLSIIDETKSIELEKPFD